MSKSLHKDMISLLKSTFSIVPQGNQLRRLNVLSCMICSCMATKSSSLEGLSSAETSFGKQSESRVKQSNRWLSSKWTDWETFFAPFARQLLKCLSGQGELILIFDGSQTGSQTTTLMASVLCKGYAIPLVWLTKKGEKGHFSEELHLDLARHLKKMLPKDCRIVFLGDGEFDGLKLRQWCQSENWEFVLRTSKDKKVECGGEIAQIHTVRLHEGEEIVFLENACDGHNAVYWHEKQYKEPIFLLTNMELGAMACKYYRRRFKIETLFKYLKSGGFKLHKTKIKEPKKIENLLIVVAFAFVFTFSIGILLKMQGSSQVAKITRKDRLEKIHPIALAQKCLAKAQKMFTRFFSHFSKNFRDFFT